MPGKKKKYNARFPPRRIKKIMQSDEEVGKVAAPVPVIISRTLELFVDSLLMSAGAITAARQARTLTPSHLKQCIMNEPRFDFLQDLFVSVPDIGTEPDSETETGTPVTPCIAPQYPFPDGATPNETTHRGRVRGRGRPRGRSVSRGRGESGTMFDDSKLSAGTSSLGTGLPHCSLKRGRSRGRPRKTLTGLEVNSRIRDDFRPSMSTMSLAIDDEDDDSNEDDVLELDLECGGSSSEDEDDDDEEEDNPVRIQIPSFRQDFDAGNFRCVVAHLPRPFLVLVDLNGRHPLWGDYSINPRGQVLADAFEELESGAKRSVKSSVGLKKRDQLSAEANVSTAITRSPVPVTNSLASAYTLPQGIQITIPGVISPLPTSNGATLPRPSGGATGVPVSVITSTQEFKKGTTPSSRGGGGGGKPTPPRVVEVDEDYDC